MGLQVVVDNVGHVTNAEDILLIHLYIIWITDTSPLNSSCLIQEHAAFAL